MAKERIILGIDPGTVVLGYGAIKVTVGKIELIEMGVLYLSKYDDHYLRLKKIFEKVTLLIDSLHPDELAIEAPFYGKNVQSMLKLGRAQGVAMAAALNRSMPVFEYSPKKIKQSITGNGNASKEQVSAMLKNLMVLKEAPEQLDASDGLAAAVCHSFQVRDCGGSTKHSGWKSFLSQNPDRKK